MKLWQDWITDKTFATEAVCKYAITHHINSAWCFICSTQGGVCSYPGRELDARSREDMSFALCSDRATAVAVFTWWCTNMAPWFSSTLLLRLSRRRSCSAARDTPQSPCGSPTRKVCALCIFRSLANWAAVILPAGWLAGPMPMHPHT